MFVFLKRFFVVAGIMALVFAFSGCTAFETDTEALLSPPVFTEEQENLNFALTEVIGEDYVLKYPENGSTNSAFIFEDLDEDGTEEAIAFYSVLDENTRINVLKNEKGKWISVYTAPGFYGDIQKVDFVKIDEKGPAVIIKWEQEIGIYRYEKEKLESVYREICEGFEVADIDGNGFYEVAVFTGSPMRRTMVNIIHGENGGIKVSEQISIHAQYDKIYAKTSGLLHEGKSAYFIDSEISEGVYLTEIMTFENGEAKREFVADFVETGDEKTEEDTSGIVVVLGGDYGERGIFLRNTKIGCLDTNGDGIIEMPAEVREDYAREASENIFFIQYVQHNGTNAVPVWNGVANTEIGYLFAIPENWNENTVIKKSSSADSFVFCEKKNGNEIFEIFAVSKNDYQDKYEDYVLAAEDETKNYYVKLTEGEESEFYIAPETLSESFIFI